MPLTITLEPEWITELGDTSLTEGTEVCCTFFDGRDSRLERAKARKRELP
jgi:hypothetical protein